MEPNSGDLGPVKSLISFVLQHMSKQFNKIHMINAISQNTWSRFSIHENTRLIKYTLPIPEPDPSRRGKHLPAGPWWTGTAISTFTRESNSEEKIYGLLKHILRSHSVLRVKDERKNRESCCPGQQIRSSYSADHLAIIGPQEVPCFRKCWVCRVQRTK